MAERESPIMTYGGNDSYFGGLCPPGTELNMPMIAFVLVVLYVLWLWVNQDMKHTADEATDATESFYVDLNANNRPLREGAQFVEVMKADDDMVYDYPYLSKYPTQSVYAGTSGYGRNY